MSTIDSKDDIDTDTPEAGTLRITPQVMMDQQLDALRGLLITALTQIDSLRLINQLYIPTAQRSGPSAEPDEEPEIPATFGSKMNPEFGN